MFMATVSQSKPAPLQSFPVFFKDSRGTLDIHADYVFLNTGHGKSIKKNYITGLRKTGKQALNRVGVEFEYYDFFGNKETDVFAMSENNFAALKKVLGK